MVNEISAILINAFTNGNKLLVCGNGGSATMSSHFAGEFVGKFKHKRKALPALALNDIAVVTAVGNDYSFDEVFSRQIEAFGHEGDILITLSTSGTSPNILQAQDTAIQKGMILVPFPTNKELGTDTAKTQETHLKMIHEIAEIVEEAFL